MQFHRSLDATAGEGMFQQVDIDIRLVGGQGACHLLTVSYVVACADVEADLPGGPAGQGRRRATRCCRAGRWSTTSRGEDWDQKVSMSLTSGAPIAFRYDLHTPRAAPALGPDFGSGVREAGRGGDGRDELRDRGSRRRRRRDRRRERQVPADPAESIQRATATRTGAYYDEQADGRSRRRPAGWRRLDDEDGRGVGRLRRRVGRGGPQGVGEEVEGQGRGEVGRRRPRRCTFACTHRPGRASGGVGYGRSYDAPAPPPDTTSATTPAVDYESLRRSTHGERRGRNGA